MGSITASRGVIMAEETGAETTEATEQSEGSRLRQERDAAVQEMKEARQELLGHRITGLGLKPDEGLGVAIMESFKGKPTDDAVREFALERYKYSPAEAVPTEAVNEPTQRMEQVSTVSAPVEPPPTVDAVAEADAALHNPEGATRQEAQRSTALKMARYRQMRQSGQIVPQ
jgi:hypothetical protein